jgi:hypothetical protein
MGADGTTPTAIENGNVLKLGNLLPGEREVYVGGAVAATDKVSDIVLIASPEVIYDEHKRNLDDYINEAGKACRGYHIHHGDTFSVTAGALSGTGTPVIGNIIKLVAGTKLGFAATLGTNGVGVGRIIDIDTVGKYTYYVIKAD